MPHVKVSVLRRPLLPIALFALAALPSCNSSTPPITIGTGTRAVVQITVDPNPIVATQNTLTLSASVSYKVTLTETNGLGGDIVFVNGSVYDPSTGTLVAVNYYDDKDMLVYVGKTRIEAMQSLSFPQSASYTLPNGSKVATLTVSVQLKDDNGNLVNSSLLVNIQ